MNIVMVNGFLLFMLFMWTSAEMEPDTAPTGELHDQNHENENRLNIQARRKACRNLGGKCIKKKRDCPNNRPLKTAPGRPYCSKRRHCCYPAPPTESPILVRDETILELTEILFAADIHNQFGNLIITGDADKLLSTSDPNIFAGATYAALRKLQLDESYVPSIEVKETEAPRIDKQNAFIDAIMDTDVMKITEIFLKVKGKISSTGDLVEKMKNMWFSMYSRTNEGNKRGSSGFEHVFRGEITERQQEVYAFHNWVFTFHEQDTTPTPNLVYTPPLNNYRDLESNGKTAKLVEMKFRWHNLTKFKTNSTSMFIGTSPELEMAVYTVCVLMELDICPVRMGKVSFDIKTKKFKNTDFVGTAYPVLPPKPL